MLTEDGGHARYLESALPIFSEFGVHLTVATLGCRGPLHESAERASNVTSIALCSKRQAVYTGAVLALRRLVRAGEYDVVHAHEVIPAALIGLARGKRSALRLMFHRHHTFSSSNHAMVSRFAAARADLIVGISAAARQAALLHDRCPPPKVVVAYSGVPAPRSGLQDSVERIRRTLKIDPQDQVVLSLGRLREEKGHRTLIEAAAVVAPSVGRNVRFVIVGDGPEKEKLSRQAGSLGVKVTFAGHQEQVDEWYMLSDLMVQPSYADASPLTVMEAMSCAKTVIGSDVGGIPEVVVNNRTGLLVPPKDPSSLAAAIVALLQDDELRRQMATNARKRYAAMFTSHEMVRRWVECYEHVLDQGPKKASA